MLLLMRDGWADIEEITLENNANYFNTTANNVRD